ncbi:hypothetical protein [Lachnospira sp.]|jgi:hypothetical protein|uniref:hypothetical protein n=1 Tax=Lachnospira sp. TaxID=2049031 RepID=UPI00257C73EC|nr:hypothetical protein [Lachnospira sp.]
MQAPSENFQPFKDAESGIEFNLSNEYYDDTGSKTFTIVGESVTTNYNIVRSAASLLPGTTWHITNK